MELWVLRVLHAFQKSVERELVSGLQHHRELHGVAAFHLAKIFCGLEALRGGYVALHSNHAVAIYAGTAQECKGGNC